MVGLVGPWWPLAHRGSKSENQEKGIIKKFVKVVFEKKSEKIDKDEICSF